MRQEQTQRKPPSVIVLEALLDGRIIEKDGERYCLSDDLYFCLIGHKLNNKTNERTDVLLKVGMGDFGLKDFVQFCDTFSDAELFLLCAEQVLNRINKKKRI